jgi:hypothetical protein
MVGDFQFDIAIYGLFSKNLSTSGATGQSKFRTEPNDRGPKKTKMHAPPLLQLSHRTEALGIGGATSFRRRTPTRAPLPDPPLSHTQFPRAVLVLIGRPSGHHFSLSALGPARIGSAQPGQSRLPGRLRRAVGPQGAAARALRGIDARRPGPARPARLSERGRRPAARAAPAGPTGAGESQKVT